MAVDVVGESSSSKRSRDCSSSAHTKDVTHGVPRSAIAPKRTLTPTTLATRPNPVMISEYQKSSPSLRTHEAITFEIATQNLTERLSKGWKDLAQSIDFTSIIEW